jgi:uncharacterized lipoprotein YajG
MKRAIVPMLTLGVFALLAGCATTRGHTHLAVPEPAAAVAPSSTRVIVIDSVSDTREFQADPRDPSIPSLKPGEQYRLDAKQRETAIGRKRNTWGKAMGDWVLDDGQTVVSVTRDLVATTLRSLGYQVGSPSPDGPAPEHVKVVIDRFWAWFTPGLWTATIEAKVGTQLQFSGPAGNQSIVVNGYGRNQVQTGREANWQLAYDRAFKNYEKNLRQAMRNSVP